MRKVSKQREYAAMLRAQHSTMKKQQEKKGSIQQPFKPKHIKEAEAKRQAVSSTFPLMGYLRSRVILTHNTHARIELALEQAFTCKAAPMTKPSKFKVAIMREAWSYQISWKPHLLVRKAL